MITGDTRKNGTVVEFWPDGTIFETTEFQFDILAKRFKELAYLNPKISITLNDERNGVKEVYKFEGGIAQFVEDISSRTALTKVVSFSDKPVISKPISLCFITRVTMKKYSAL